VEQQEAASQGGANVPQGEVRTPPGQEDELGPGADFPGSNFPRDGPASALRSEEQPSSKLQSEEPQAGPGEDGAAQRGLTSQPSGSTGSELDATGSEPDTTGSDNPGSDNRNDNAGDDPEEGEDDPEE
jgi:hypothetical protein